MSSLREREVENARVRVRCLQCRTTFHERLNRIIHGDRVTCPSWRNEMHFHGIGHIRGARQRRRLYPSRGTAHQPSPLLSTAGRPQTPLSINRRRPLVLASRAR